MKIFVKGLAAAAVLTASASLALAEADLAELERRLEHAKKEERREAVYQLEKLGEAAAPLVPRLARALEDEDDQVWHGATMTLAAIGPQAAPAIPDLMEQMGGGRSRYQEQRRHRSAYALSCIGEAAIPAITGALTDENAHRRWGALHALGLMGEKAHAFLPRMMPLLGDEDESVRLEAQEACVALGEVSVIPVAEQLGHENKERRESAAKVLRRLGPAADSQRLRVLQALLNEADTDVRAALLETAVALGGDPEFLSPLLVDALLGGPSEQDAVFNAILATDAADTEFIPKLALLLSDSAPEHRELAASLLGRLGKRALAAAPMLVARLEADVPADQADWYVTALILIGPEVIPALFDTVQSAPPEDVEGDHWVIQVLHGLGPLAVEDLERRLEHASPTVACAILQALPEYKGRQRALERRVIPFLSHENAVLRAQAVSMLGRLTLPEQVSLKAARQALSDPAPRVRVAALEALSQVPISDSERLDILMAALDANESEVRLAAVQELGKLGPKAEPAVSRLLATAQGPSAAQVFRAEVVRALGLIGEGAGKAVPFLMDCLGESAAEGLQPEVLNALAAIGEPARPALSSITKLIDSGDEQLRQAAMAAFARIETDADKLIPVYLEALKDPSAEVRQPVIAGLGRLGERGRTAAKELVDLLDSEPDRQSALDALQEMGLRDVELCIRILKNDSPAARLFACDRLGRLKAKEAIPELREALRDDYGFVRRRAREALEQIEKDEG